MNAKAEGLRFKHCIQHRTSSISATDQEHEDCVQRLLEEDRRIKCDEIAAEYGISYGFAFKTLTVNLGKRKVTATWAPRRLMARISFPATKYSCDSGEKATISCSELLQTWARSNEPEFIRQSSDWRHPNTSRPQKFHRVKLSKWISLPIITPEPFLLTLSLMARL